jgi:hypothetical protein
VDTGSREENASKQESRVPFRFYRNGKGSSVTPDAFGAVAAVMMGWKNRGASMRAFRIAAVLALLTGPAFAQIPPINLMVDGPGKSPEQQAAEAARDKAYKDSLKKIPDAKAPSDPWGAVRSGDAAKPSAPKAAASKGANSKTANSKTAASAKPRTKTGSAAD